MFNFDKLFAKDNIIVLKNQTTGHVYYYTADEFGMNWNDYKNESLSYTTLVNNVINTTFTIQSIIRLNEKGDVVEKLFDRVTDMPPIVETGMFVEISQDFKANQLGVVVKDRVHCQNGESYLLSEFNDGVYPFKNYAFSKKIVKIWDENSYGFNGCERRIPIWEDKE